MLLHYLGKRKNQKIAILMHVKHVLNVTFLSSIQQIKEMPNVVEISAKINTMQYINVLLVVHSLSVFTVRNKPKAFAVKNGRPIDHQASTQ